MKGMYHYQVSVETLQRMKLFISNVSKTDWWSYNESSFISKGLRRVKADQNFKVTFMNEGTTLEINIWPRLQKFEPKKRYTCWWIPSICMFVCNEAHYFTLFFHFEITILVITIILVSECGTDRCALIKFGQLSQWMTWFRSSGEVLGW